MLATGLKVLSYLGEVAAGCYVWSTLKRGGSLSYIWYDDPDLRYIVTDKNQPRVRLTCEVVQVFEYLNTDLKRYMDRTGKGPNSTPLPQNLIKVQISWITLFDTNKTSARTDFPCIAELHVPANKGCGTLPQAWCDAP